MHAHAIRCSRGAVVLAAALLSTTVASAQPLRRDLPSYAIMAIRRAGLKNTVLTGACNVGVNCASTTVGDTCGVMTLDDVNFGTGSQTAADEVKFFKSGAKVWQLFANLVGSPQQVTVGSPPIQPFATPILPGTCTADCVPDFAAIEALCGFPTPFPACDPTKNVTANDGQDCGAVDAVAGNQACDLPPGTYGNVEVRNGATLRLSAGTYVLCDLNVSRQATVFGADSLVRIASGGGFRVGSNSRVVGQCGDVTVQVSGAGTVAFGRNADITADVCAPRTTVSLGHSNVLTGHYVGDVVLADQGNEVRCCGGACTCFDELDPTTAAVGANVRLTSHCDLRDATGVTVCGVPATVVSKGTTATGTELIFTVPAGVAGSCTVTVESPAGSFAHVTPLVVS